MSIWIWICSRHLVCISWKYKPVAASCRHQSRSSSACQWWDSRCWSSCWARADYSGWLSGLRLPVASSDLRTKRVAQLGANLWLYHVTRDDNDILWGLATKSDKISFMRWKGLERWKLISSSSQFLKCSSTAGTCISPADFLRFEAFARPQASSYGPVKLEKQRFSAQTEPW